MSRFKEVVAARTALELLIDLIRNPHGAQEAMAVYAAEIALVSVKAVERLYLADSQHEVLQAASV